MRRLALLSLLALLAAPVEAPLALVADTTDLFSCAISNETAADGIELIAIDNGDGSWSAMQLLIIEDGRQFWLPAAPVDPRGHFFFSNSEGPEGYYAQVRFADAGTDYVLHMIDIPPDPTDANDMGGRSAGLTITGADGSSRELSCGETDEYIGLMHEAMSCDMTNRYGAAGCNFDVRPTRATNDKLPAGYAP